MANDYLNYISAEGIPFRAEDPMSGPFYSDLTNVTVIGKDFYKRQYHIPEDDFAGTASPELVYQDIRERYPNLSLSNSLCKDIYNIEAKIKDELILYGKLFYNNRDSEEAKELLNEIQKDIENKARLTGNSFELNNSALVAEKMSGIYSVPDEERVKRLTANMLTEMADFEQKLKNNEIAYGGEPGLRKFLSDERNLALSDFTLYMTKKYGTLFTSRTPLTTIGPQLPKYYDPNTATPELAERNRNLNAIAQNQAVNIGTGYLHMNINPWDNQASLTYFNTAGKVLGPGSFATAAVGALGGAGLTPFQMLVSDLGGMATSELYRTVGRDLATQFGGDPDFWGNVGSFVGFVPGYGITRRLVTSLPAVRLQTNIGNRLVSRGYGYPRYSETFNANPNEAFIWDTYGLKYTGPNVAQGTMSYKPGTKILVAGKPATVGESDGEYTRVIDDETGLEGFMYSGMIEDFPLARTTAEPVAETTPPVTETPPPFRPPVEETTPEVYLFPEPVIYKPENLISLAREFVESFENRANARAQGLELQPSVQTDELYYLNGRIVRKVREDVNGNPVLEDINDPTVLNLGDLTNTGTQKTNYQTISRKNFEQDAIRLYDNGQPNVNIGDRYLTYDGITMEVLSKFEDGKVSVKNLNTNEVTEMSALDFAKEAQKYSRPKPRGTTNYSDRTLDLIDEGLFSEKPIGDNSNIGRTVAPTRRTKAPIYDTVIIDGKEYGVENNVGDILTLRDPESFSTVDVRFSDLILGVKDGKHTFDIPQPAGYTWFPKATPLSKGSITINGKVIPRSGALAKPFGKASGDGTLYPQYREHSVGRDVVWPWIKFGSAALGGATAVGLPTWGLVSYIVNKGTTNGNNSGKDSINYIENTNVSDTSVWNNLELTDPDIVTLDGKGTPESGAASTNPPLSLTDETNQQLPQSLDYVSSEDLNYLISKEAFLKYYNTNDWKTDSARQQELDYMRIINLPQDLLKAGIILWGILHGVISAPQQ